MDKDEMKSKLTPEQYSVMFEKGTEPRFSKNWNITEKGMYNCAACGNPLFSSDAKFELDPNDWNYGWPSFDDPVSRENVELKDDDSNGMNRTEVICKKCGAHIGHLFNDGPKETTGMHYCVNSCALNFTPEKK
ncbi:MAG TPA: peptide-methionine (R)-S-oxide reductase MsrB [Patescibacteria group bacterium]